MTEHIKINDTAPRAEYVGDGSTTVFPAPFPFLSSASLHVWIGNALQDEAADYTVLGARETSGGSVTFDTPPADGENVVIYRSANVERLSDFLPGGSLRADTLNDEFDRLTLGIQEVAARLDRSLLLADQDPGTVPKSLPTATARASRVLSFDADGHPTAGPATSTLSDIESAVSTATSGAIAAAASASVAADSAALVEDVAALVQNIPNMATMTGDGADTTLILPAAPVDEKALLVTLDGIVQHLSTFSVSDTTLTFSTAPPTGVAVEVRDLSSTAIIHASEVSTLAAIAVAISSVGTVTAAVSTVAANDSAISDLADDLNGANTIGAAVTSANKAASSASAAATSETNAGDSATAATSSATGAAASATTATGAKNDAETAQTAAETAEANAGTAQTAAETAEVNAAASATAAAGSASSAAAAVADAAAAGARAGFRARFGKTPPALLAFYLGTVSGLTLTRATVGTAINEGGAPDEVAIDTARIEHDIDTSERLGLLLEPAGTNLAKRSNDFTNAYWLMGANVGRVGSKTDPLGGTTATRITASASGTSTANYIREASGGGHTDGVFSIWVRRVTGTGNVKLLGLNNAVGSSLNITSSLTGEWPRFTHSGTPGGSGFIYFGVGVEVSGNAVDVAFAHCEGDIGDVPTSSYIETVASEVTRSADVATIDLTALAGFRPAGFTLIADLTIRGTDGTALAAGKGASQECAFDMQSGDLHITSSNGLDLTAASGLAIGDRILVALRMREDSVAVSVNGAAVVTDTSYTIDGDANELQLGANISGADLLACVIHEIAFFGPLPDATLEAMSNV